MHLSIENDDDASFKWSMASGEVEITFTKFEPANDDNVLKLTSMRLQTGVKNVLEMSYEI